MKALVVRQPWATLIALGVKTIETRPSPPNGPMRPDGVRGLPGCTLERGERIAIVAGASKPKVGERFGDLDVLSSEWTYALSDYLVTSTAQDRWIPLPLGAVVCTVTVDEALPVRSEGTLSETIPASGCLAVTRSGHPTPSLTRIEWRRNAWTGAPATYCELATDGVAPTTRGQHPLGDFTPGRWGWLLSDPQPCGPVPCKGRQGVFQLPADVAEQAAS